MSREVLGMEFNRNHYFMTGVIIVLIGIQLRLVDSYVLNEGSTRFLNARMGTAESSEPSGASRLFPAVGSAPRKVLRPPQWIGWALMSVGSVLLLHSLAMRAPHATA